MILRMLDRRLLSGHRRSSSGHACQRSFVSHQLCFSAKCLASDGVSAVQFLVWCCMHLSSRWTWGYSGRLNGDGVSHPVAA